MQKLAGGLAAIVSVLAAGEAGAQAPLDLQVSPRWNSCALAVSESGLVSGYFGVVPQQTFLWSQAEGASVPEIRLISAGSAVNDAGQVVGYYHPHDAPPQRAFSWTPSGGVVDLGPGCALALNGGGQVVGFTAAPGGATRAFSWTEAGGMVDLGAGIARAVNGAGLAVGGDAHAVAWRRGGATDLGTLGGAYSDAIAVSESGQVVGWSDLAGGARHAFSWTRGGGMVDLGSLGGDSYAIDVNDAGLVVGWSYLADGARHAFAWTRGAGMIDLGTLGGAESEATAVNSSGLVVGSSSLADGSQRAFAWTRTGGMVDLGTLGGSAAEALAVNGSGRVVGWSTTGLVNWPHAARWEVPSLSVASATISRASTSGAGSVVLAMDLGIAEPAADAVVAAALDGAPLFSIPFGAFRSGGLPGTFAYVGDGVLVRLDLVHHDLLVAGRTDLAGLSPGDGVDVTVTVGGAAALERISMRRASPTTLVYRR